MTPIADWRIYFRFKLLDTYAPFMAQDYEQAEFDFHSRVLHGVKEQQPRWKRSVQTMDGAMGELIGKLYVAKNFSPEAKQRMLTLVGNLMKAFDRSIDNLEWMSPATKAEARKKLAKFTVKIGYPDKWRDYSALVILPGDLLGNVRRAGEFEFARQVAKLGKPIDRSEWLITPQTVNAYYYPPMNEIVFPAAILRPPFFAAQADDAVNYGGIGSVIGHETSHGFDDQGRQFDGEGNLRDWWTADDNANFRARAARLGRQYSSYTVIDNLKINGELTMGENIGDLSGVAMAYKAWQIALDGRASPMLDGYTGPQRFFLGWATIWRRSYRDDELRVRAVTDPHSLSEFRVNGVVTNLDAFYEAFGVKEGDKLYRAPADRVKIW
jgi:predicted metalloendopeptidase